MKTTTKLKSYCFGLSNSISNITVKASNQSEAYKKLYNKFKKTTNSDSKLTFASFKSNNVRICLPTSKKVFGEVPLSKCNKSTFNKTVLNKYKGLF